MSRQRGLSRMKILGINGSHRPGRGTAALLGAVLEAAQEQGVDVEQVELAELEIGFCIGCNTCLGKAACALHDDMDILIEKMREADGIVLASPDYFSSITARMKSFMERTRPLHMVENALKGKVGGMVATAGLDNCGIEETMAAMERWFATHEMLVVHARPAGPVLGSGATATGFAGLDEEGKPIWRSVKRDAAAFACARQLGGDLVELAERLSGSRSCGAGSA